MKYFSFFTDRGSRSNRMRATIAVACLLVVLPLQSAGQKRALAVAAKVNPTPDALVFSDRTSVYYLAANSSVPRKLAKGNYPALSPDRQRVAYCLPQNSDVSAPAAATVMLFDLATGKSTTVLRANAWIAHLRWSPNGESITLTLALSSGKRELDTVAPDGTHRQKLITGGEQGTDDIFSPAWAPDGQSIYFQDMSNLVQVSTSGEVVAKTPLGPITEEKEAVTSADSFVPSPAEANVLAYTRSVPGTPFFEKTFGEPNTALFLYDLRTKSRKRLTSPEVLAMDPVWSRDGRFIYFTGYRDREGRASYPFKIYRIGRDGTGLIQITSGEMPGV
jgi:TolB protein